MTTLLSLLATAAGAWAALVAAMYLGQERLLFLPWVPGRAHEATPADAGLAFEDAWITASDGVRLHAWWVPAPEPRGALLFLHGNAGNVSHRLDSLRIFHRLGLSVLILDYRGYGRSEGSPSEAGALLDVQAAWRHLVEARAQPPPRVAVFGRSMGAALAASVAAREAPAALILESGFTSVPELAGDLYWWMPARRLARIRLDTRGALASVRAPVLVVHSVDDEIIPFAHAEALYAAARPPKSLLRLRGDHNAGFLLSGEHYVNGLDRFLDATIGRD